MSSVIARRVSSIPVRTSVATWNTITALLTAPEQAARTNLESITNVAAMLIAEEYTRDSPVVVMPATGPRIRIYTVHGADAIDGAEAELPLATWPLTEGGWRLSLPCAIHDIDGVRAALLPYTFIEVRDAEEGIAAEAAMPAPRRAGAVSVNYTEMGRL